jgi:hypothetical protein
MKELVAQLLSNGISRRDFVRRLVASGVTVTAAKSILESVDAFAQSPTAPAAGDAVKTFQGNGGEAFAEQLIASGVKYVFGNSASEDAEFYEALVNRPQLQYILTPHEGPGAAMAAGYVKASGEPAVMMTAGSVGLMNALGQMFNAWKEQTPLVFYAYRTEDSRAAGRDGFEELPGQEQVTATMTKLTWGARRPEMIPEAGTAAHSRWRGRRRTGRPTSRGTPTTPAKSSNQKSFGTIRWIRGCASARTRRKSSAQPNCSLRLAGRCSSSATRSTGRKRSTRSCSSRSCSRCP